MSIDKVFCIVPWVEVHINADGTYHSCGAQVNWVTGTETAKKQNVHNMSISDWVNSEYQKRARLEKVNGEFNSLCNICYHEEDVGSSSKRIREFPKISVDYQNFEETYNKNPLKEHFDFSKENNGLTNFIKPTSYHISLGNECNLACKMCRPSNSTKIAVKQILSGEWKGPARMNWTDDDAAWDSVIDYMCSTPNLEYVHIIGGEPLMNPKFHNLIDRLLDANLTNIYLGLTTNGTIFDEQLIQKLKPFRHIDIGISVETSDVLNDYIREGSDTPQVLENIKKYGSFRDTVPGLFVTLRAVPSALSIHTLDDLYKWCIENKIDVMTNHLIGPAYLQIKQLPKDIKDKLIEQYSNWEFSDPIEGSHNSRNQEHYKHHIDDEIHSIINSLKLPNDPVLTKTLYSNLEKWGWLSNSVIAKYFNTDLEV